MDFDRNHEQGIFRPALMGMVKPVFAITILVAACLSCIGGSDAVKMGTEGAYPPYNFINDDGEVDGFERELGDELCRRADLECAWVTTEWDGIIPNLVAGSYDTILAGMSITEERDEVIDFTQPYIPPSPSVYLARAGAGDEVVDGKVAVQVSTIQADHLSQSGATPLEYPLAPEVVSAVLSGEADAALVDLGFARGQHSGEWGEPDYRGPEGDPGLRRRHRRPGGRQPVEGQAGPGHRRHEGGWLVEHPHREVVRPGSRDVLTTAPPARQTFR